MACRVPGVACPGQPQGAVTTCPEGGGEGALGDEVGPPHSRQGEPAPAEEGGRATQ